MVWQHGDLIAGWPCYILKQVKIVLPQSFLGFGWFWILLRDELSSDADDIECSDEPLNVSLTISGLEAFHGMATKNPTGEEHDDRMTSYDKNGINRERIKRAVRSPSCKCKCTVPLQLMLKICAAFWCLAKSSQDAILWSLQTSDGDRRKRYYDIEGWVLGISKQTISMCIQLWAKMYEWDLTVFYICLKPLIKITMLCWKNDVNPCTSPMFKKLMSHVQKKKLASSGYSVCRESWLRLLGVGKNRLRRTKRRHRGEDERSWKCGNLGCSCFIIYNVSGHSNI